MELRWISGLQVPWPEVDSVDEPLGQQIRRIRADEQWHERDLEFQVFLERVGLQIVSGPTHCESMRLTAQSHVRWPRMMRRSQVSQKFSARRAARRRLRSVKAAPKTTAPRTAARSGSSTVEDYAERGAPCPMVKPLKKNRLSHCGDA